MKEEAETRPRQYAAMILAEPDRDKRKAIGRTVPPEWRQLVKTHLEIARDTR